MTKDFNEYEHARSLSRPASTQNRLLRCPTERPRPEGNAVLSVLSTAAQ